MSTGPAMVGTSSLPPHITVQLVERPRRRWWRFLWWAVMVILLLAVIQMSVGLHEYFDTTGGIQERYYDGSQTATKKIAIIDVSGLIVEGEGFVKKQIDRVRKDENVVAVVVRVDSPGGTVSGADYLFHHLKKLREDRRLPLVVSMGSVAASGGYYVAMAVGDQPGVLFAEPTTMTGSIGVLIPHYDISGLLERWNVSDQSIASHPRKLMLSMTRPMPDEHRQLLEKHVNALFSRFKEIVRYGRPALRQAPGDALEHNGVDLATGEIFTADQALEYGLIDKIGFLEDAVARAAQLAGTTTDAVRVVRYRRQGLLVDSLLDSWSARQRVASGSNWLELLEAAVPKAYYLWTTWPPLLSTYRIAE